MAIWKQAGFDKIVLAGAGRIGLSGWMCSSKSLIFEVRHPAGMIDEGERKVRKQAGSTYECRRASALMPNVPRASTRSPTGSLNADVFTRLIMSVLSANEYPSSR